MKNINSYPKPTKAALETALVNSFKMHGKYTCTATETGDLFIVQNMEDNTPHLRRDNDSRHGTMFLRTVPHEVRLQASSIR